MSFDSHQAGQRVVAVRDADNETVNVYGPGVYVGDRPRPGTEQMRPAERAMYEDAIREHDAGGTSFEMGMIDRMVELGQIDAGEAEARRERARAAHDERLATPMEQRCQALHDKMALNPLIQLDSGDTVWGYQCWWGPEAAFEESFTKGRRVVTVPVPAGNERWR